MHKLSDDFWITLDGQGFPLIRRAKWNFFISLFPVTEAQYGNSTNHPSDLNSPWQNFARGLDRQKIDDFLVSLNGKQQRNETKEEHKDDLIHMIEQGSKYRLPTQEQWNELLECSEPIQSLRNELRAFCRDQSASSTAQHLVEEKQFPLVEEGLLEWIRGNKDREQQIMGRPWQKLLPNLMHPNTLRIIKDREYNAELSELIGFRLVREAPPLKRRLERFLLLCQELERSQGKLSQIAVFGTPEEPLATPRFRYLSPQVEAKKSFNEHSDLFFLGIVFMETMCGFPCDFTTASWKNSEFAEGTYDIIAKMISPPYAIRSNELIKTVETLISLSEAPV